MTTNKDNSNTNYLQMKKILFAVFVSLIAGACSENNAVEIGNKTSMVVNETFDAGTVVKGEIIKATFTVRNTGNYPLVISEVKGSCSCTVASRPEEPIQPGEDAVIKAEVDTENASVGRLSKSVRIVANTEPSITEVGVTANVKRN